MSAARIVILLAMASFSVSSTTTGQQEQFLHEDKAFWYKKGKEDLRAAIYRRENVNVAKNVIIFLGDGMGPSTVTAARILAGQKLGKLGEEHFLHFEQFKHVGLVKTYNVDKQVADSAGSATAYLTGVKGRYGTVGLDVSAPYNICRPDLGHKPHVQSILKWAQDAGKDTGLVTTTRVTHATPAGLYAHSANRDWECDSQIPLKDRQHCKDISRQLVEDEPGRNIKIVLGGGRATFTAAKDDGSTKWPCKRGDNLDLIGAWKVDKKQRGKTHLYIENRTQLLDPELNKADFVLGLFGESHVPYEIDRVSEDVAPGIVDMTRTAINFLQKNKKQGFFLLVEGGRIDHAHHENNALRALEEVVAMDEAIRTAKEMTDEEDTLIIVTADHSHAFNINGYPVRGNPITGLSGQQAQNGYNYTTLSYSTGPGFWQNLNNQSTDPSFPWHDPSTRNISSKNYKQVAQTPMHDARHGGEDVAVYATGPMAHLVHGVHEQNYVAHVMGHAACIGPYSNDCDIPGRSGSSSLHYSSYVLLTFVFLLKTIA